MRFAAHLLGLAALVSATSATLDYFLLKTTLASGETKSGYDNSYVGVYEVTDTIIYPLVTREHNGAAFFYLTTSKKVDGVQYYDLQINGSAKGPDYRLDLDVVSPDTLWQPFMYYDTHKAAAYESGFYLDDGHVLYTTNRTDTANNAFNGWLVCEWWTGYRQLFYLTDLVDASTYTPLETCAKVELSKVPLV